MFRLSSRETTVSREQVLHLLYEAAELEHCLMCTYLYAAFSLKTDQDEGLSRGQLSATRRWRQTILQVAAEEMTHLAAVWNITAALGGAPRTGRQNLPLDPGYLPASVVVKLAPFDRDTLQHFVFLERPAGSAEPDGEGFAVEQRFSRGTSVPRITPMAVDYATVGEFYEAIGQGLRDLVGQWDEAATFCGDPALQLTTAEVALPGLERVICLKTALAALDTIVAQGEGAPQESEASHFQRFCGIRAEMAAACSTDPSFVPARPVATNPVLRTPPRAGARVQITDPAAATVVDLANSVYGLMLRCLACAYSVPAGDRDKTMSLELAVGLMHAFTPLAEHAARLPAAPGSPVNAGVSFIALRDSAAFPPGRSARRLLCERLEQLGDAARRLDDAGSARIRAAATTLEALSQRALAEFDAAAQWPLARASPSEAVPVPPQVEARAADPAPVGAIEEVRGRDLTIVYEGRRCIHARFCVTGAPNVFLANVDGPWIHPDAMDTERLVEIAHACPSGAIRYVRHDGASDERPPPVNLMAVREAGPYAFRAELQIDGVAAGYRATLCRCGASRDKPFCDGSHHDAGFTASGEPVTGTQTAMLPRRSGGLAIELQRNGPLHVRGNLEIVSGTGRLVARVEETRLCRCGASNNKPYCDGSHARVGFRS